MRAFALFTALALAAPGGLRAQEPISVRRPIAPDASIRIHNLVGSTRVIGWDRDSIAVTGSAGGRFYFGASARDAKLGVELPLDEASASPSTLEVRVPRGARVWVKSASAEIEVSEVAGSLDLNSVSGAIRVSGEPREVAVESMDGAVEIAATATWVRAKSASGNLTLRGRAEDVTLSTVSGALTVEGGPFERGRYESVVGDIRFAGQVTPSGSLHFESHSGRIELRVPAAVPLDVEVTTFEGEIRNGLSPSAPRPGRDLRGRELAFATGPGGARITIRNFKGSVVLGSL